MVKRRRKNKKRKNISRRKTSLLKEMGVRFFDFLRRFLSLFPGKVKRQILASFIFLLAIVCFLSFFGAAGKGGTVLKEFLFMRVGFVIYTAPFIFLLASFCILYIPKKFFGAEILALISLLLGFSGILNILNHGSFWGGSVGELISAPLVGVFGIWVALATFVILAVLGISITWYFLAPYILGKEEEKETMISKTIKKVISFPKFKVSKIEGEEKISSVQKETGEEKRGKVEPVKTKSLKLELPSIELLKEDGEKALAGDIKQNAIIIKKTLENFSIEVSMAEVNIGPTVTQYTLKPAEGVKLSKITGLSNNLSLALAAHPIRIEAPIPGKSLVGIEIPNKVRSKVRLRSLISHLDFRKPSSGLSFVLGRDVAGAPVFGDLCRLPHLLVAGATGTGKTIFLNSLILSLLYQNSPETLRFILIDPKRVEFPIYNDLPHLLCPVVLDHERATNVLKWLVDEMERRFNVLSEVRAKDMASFNEKAVKNGTELLPYIVLIIDELADLMAARGKEVEAAIIRIAQMARAVGIHLVLATQRPSVEVITGLIKANITSRISFQVASQFDSRTILDMAGSEKLLGLGDMLYMCAERIKPQRIQGSFVSEDEVKKVVRWLVEKAEKMEEEIKPKDNLAGMLRKSIEAPSSEVKTFKPGDDSLYEEAKQIVMQYKKASASLLQRRLSIGYARAARLLDMLEAEGVIGPHRGSKPREVYIKREDSELPNESLGDSFEDY